MTDYYQIALDKHEEWLGKLTTEVKVPLATKTDLSIA